MKTIQLKNKFFLIALTAALTACGGGGGGGSDDSATAVAAPPQPATSAAAPGDMMKYAGTWSTACMPEGQQSARMTLVLTSSSSSATGRIVADGYGQANCTGPTAQMALPFSASYIETVGGSERLNVSDGSETSPMLATFSANGLTLTLADGEDTFVFNKQP